MWRVSVSLVLGLLALPTASARPAATPSAAPAAEAVAAIGLTVSSLERSITFFQEVLTFELTDQWEQSGRATELLTGVFGARTRTARLRLGAQVIELTEFAAPRGRPYPVDTRANDQWFQHIAIVVSDMSMAYRRLRDHGVAHASTGPQRLPDWNPDAGGIQAFYFRDPDGHFLEVLQFPPGRGDAAWQRRDRLFLGIDHTAIVSTDTARSLRFYSGGFGLAVAGGAENHGVEQEHLNNVFGVRLRITTLRAKSGPGIELLDTSRRARDGRRRSTSAPPTSRTGRPRSSPMEVALLRSAFGVAGLAGRHRRRAALGLQARAADPRSRRPRHPCGRALKRFRPCPIQPVFIRRLVHFVEFRRSRQIMKFVSTMALALVMTLSIAGGAFAQSMHTTGKFSGAKVNAGTVTHSMQAGRHVLTLSSDFQVPDTPDPHWQVVDSKGTVHLLQRLGIKGDIEHRHHPARARQGRRQGADLLRLGRGRPRRGVVLRHPHARPLIPVALPVGRAYVAVNRREMPS